MQLTDTLGFNELPAYTIQSGGANGASAANGGNGLNSLGNPLNFPVFISVQDQLTIGETIATTGGSVILPSDGLTVAETIRANKDINRSFDDSSTVVETITAIIVSRGGIGGQTTGIGSQQSANAAIRNGLPVLSDPSDVVFTANYGTLTIRKPKFGDQDQREVFRVQVESRGRELIVFEDAIWPKTEIFVFEFEYLTQSVAKQVINFLQATVGQRITYIDYYGRSWTGCILNPDAVIEQLGKKNFSAKFQFQVIQ